MASRRNHQDDREARATMADDCERQLGDAQSLAASVATALEGTGQDGPWQEVADQMDVILERIKKLAR